MAKFLGAAARAIAFACAAAMMLTVVDAHAHFNPSVRESFFEDLHAAAPASKPAPVAVDGAVTEVTWEGLAWEVQNAGRTNVPLVIEFYSMDAAQCGAYNVTGPAECVAQILPTARTAASFGSKVRFVRFDVSRHPAVLGTPDVRVLPMHIFVAAYTDTAHYKAVRVWGYLNQTQLTEVVTDTFDVRP
jgi:hypothetical protein